MQAKPVHPQNFYLVAYKVMCFNVEFKSLVDEKDKQYQKKDVPGFHVEKISPKIGKEVSHMYEL